MAVNHINKIDHISDSPCFHAVRLPFQVVLIIWAWWYIQSSNAEEQAAIVPEEPQTSE